MTIGELAGRTGFPASTLRYYDEIGLVRPGGHSDAGYRRYGDDALERLAFVARAKDLGCSLEEIADLLSLSDGERCGPVQRRFHELVTEKLATTQQRIGQLAMLSEQLRRAATRLDGPPVDGPCDDRCACTASGGAAEPSVIACKLDGLDVERRLTDWHDLLATAGARTALPDGGLRIELGLATDLATLAELVAAERACCAFLSFAITVDDRGPALEVRGPAEATDVVGAIFAAT
ncbi:MAG: MerR family transcriptional regulator [Ilumatobacteraceae bacterium]